MFRYWIVILFLASNFAYAERWKFSNKIPVSPYYGKKIFHHLDSTGRNNTAIANATLAVTWEDNHSGSPQIYVVFKTIPNGDFSSPVKVNTGQSAYSPVITPFKNNSFLIAWEQGGQIWLGHISASGISRPVQISHQTGRQASILTFDTNTAIVAWCDTSKRLSRIVTSTVTFNDKGQVTTRATPVDKQPAKDNQLYPTLLKANGIATIIWEDRRYGHTILLYSQSRDGKHFQSHQLLNDIVQKSPDYGRGNGVTRAAATHYGSGNKKMAVTWMDKRNFSTGYDIYAALGNKTGTKFGKNHIVQDVFGNDISQWNPAITGSPQGDIVVAWDDNRDDTSDIWLSWKTRTGWSEDMLVEPASGDGQQSGPSIVMDAQQNLHLVWIDQQQDFGPTRLFYSFGKRIAAH